MNKWLLALLVACSFAACKKDDDDDEMTLNDTDRTFMTNASYGNNAEVDAGSAAQTMATLPSVKSFGGMMVADHSAAQAQLRDVAQQVGVTNLPTMPDSAHIHMKMMLMSLSGRAFDSAYMNMQVVDHVTNINLFQNEIANGKDQRVKDYASSKLPGLQMHKQKADSIIAANGF